ncbi:MAG: N-acetylmuramoyl-L-alanine amidase [Gloeomargaritales cyanobacterium]
MTALQPPKQLTRFSANKYIGRKASVGLITLHESVGMTDAWQLALFCERQGVSYHAVADNDQMIYTVSRSDTAWHLRNGNAYADGLCLTTPTAGYTRDEWLGPQVKKVQYAAWWLAGVCLDRNLHLAHISYADIRSVVRGNWSVGGVMTHDDYTKATGDGTHNDPRNFPTDVAVQWAKDFQSGVEDDMATVPQTEWNQVRDAVNLLLQELRGPGGKGWDSFRVTNKATLTTVDFIRSIDRETNQQLNLDGRPYGDTDSLLGHILSTRAELRKAAATWDAYIARNK